MEDMGDQAMVDKAIKAVMWVLDKFLTVVDKVIQKR